MYRYYKKIYIQKKNKNISKIVNNCLQIYVYHVKRLLLIVFICQYVDPRVFRSSLEVPLWTIFFNMLPYTCKIWKCYLFCFFRTDNPQLLNFIRTRQLIKQQKRILFSSLCKGGVEQWHNKYYLKGKRVDWNIKKNCICISNCFEN